METRKDGKLALFIGVTRSGKSVPVKRITEQNSRVLVFDPKGEYVAQMGFVACQTRAELVEALEGNYGAAKVSFVSSSKADFQFFCACAFNWVRMAPAVIVAEELANVTNTGKAEGEWGRLVNQGLAFGPLIVGTVQRGQDVDKGIMNNATFLHVNRHSTDDDAAYIAQKLGVEVAIVPRKPLEFFQWTSDLGVVVAGRVDFENKPTAIWPNGVPRFIGKKAGAKSAAQLAIQSDGTFKGVQYR